jgi:signal transduction histidine kinase
MSGGRADLRAPTDPDDQPGGAGPQPSGEAHGDPGVALLEAINAWCESASSGRRTDLSRALGRFVASRGGRGARMELGGRHIPAVSVCVGKMRRTLAASRRGRPVGDERIPAVPLLGRGLAVGSLAVDGPAEVLRSASGLVEAALATAISRAEAIAATDRLEALDAATRAIAGVLSTERVLQLIVDSLRRLVQAQYAALGIVDATRRMDPFITSGMSRAARERLESPPHGLGLLGLIVDEARPIRVDDIAMHPRRHGFPPNHPEMRSLLGVPVMVRGRAIGNLYVADRLDGAPFGEDDQRLVELFANHAGIAIENARLHEQEQRIAILEERQRIGRDLHDGIIQRIYAVGLTLDDAYETMLDDTPAAREKVERAIESLNLTIRDIRNFIFGLQPEPFDQAGLVDALASMGEDFRVNTTVETALEVEGSSDLEISADATLQLLNLVREALSNVARHAHARRTSIRLVVDENVLEIAVVDDGVGFDPGARRGPGHMGLSNMRARAAELEGEFLVESAVGRGTRVVVRVPIAGVAPDAGTADVG